MDAISFVLGVQSRDLRSSQMLDLIFRPPGDVGVDDEALRASATLVYQHDDAHNKSHEDGSSEEESDGTNDDDDDDDDSEGQRQGRGRDKPKTKTKAPKETRFSRSISAKGVGEYRINHKPVSFAAYEQALASIGVLLRGRNFLIFQGDVESTARKSPRELVQWFEEISQSSLLKQSYDEALREMTEAEAHARAASQKQKGYWKKKRELKGQKDEAEKFKSLVDSKARVLTEYFLWQLFHIRADIDEEEEAWDDLNQELEQANVAAEALANDLRAAKKDASAARSQAAKVEKKRVKVTAEIDQVQPSMIQKEQEIKNLEKKIAAEKKKHTKIAKEAEQRGETLEKLEKEIKEYGETERHLQQEYEETKQKGGQVSLTEEQEAEYERIREAAAVSSAKPRQALSAANRRLDNARAKAASVSDEIKELAFRKNDATNKVNELTERRDKLEEVRVIRIRIIPYVPLHACRHLYPCPHYNTIIPHLHSFND